MGIITLTQDNFDEIIEKNRCVVVDFWTKDCAPCRTFAPIYERVSASHPDVVFAQVDIESESELAQDFGILSVPFLMIFRGEFAIFAESGAQTQKGLNQLVEDAKALDLETLRAQVKPSSSED